MLTLMQDILTVSNLSKTFASGLAALSGTSLAIRCGEIVALLGLHDASKTTLIDIIFGIVNQSEGPVLVDGFFHRERLAWILKTGCQFKA